jgi:hypothetical protein
LIKYNQESITTRIVVPESCRIKNKIVYLDKKTMDEIEIPTEHLHETIQEKVEEEIKEEIKEEKKEKGWFMYVAISTALMAVLAAVAGLMAGHHSNEALISQIKSSDQWAYYQAKGIKAEIKTLEISLAKATPADVEKYKKEQEEIKKQAEEAQADSKFHLDKHIILSRAVTLLQISIAISAIAILTKKKFLWWLSMLIATGGLVFFLSGL